MNRQEIVEIIIEAISRTSNHYRLLYNPDNYSKAERNPEHLFCYEFYHQLRLVFSDEDFHIDGEIYKTINGANTIIKDPAFLRTKNVLMKSDGLYPDIVIHKSQMSRDSKDQLLILECKTQPENLDENAFFKDFFKLNTYNEYLNFQNSIYLIVNKDSYSIEQFLKSYYKKNYWLSKKDVIIFLLENSNSKLYQIQYLDKKIEKKVINSYISPKD